MELQDTTREILIILENLQSKTFCNENMENDLPNLTSVFNEKKSQITNPVCININFSEYIINKSFLQLNPKVCNSTKYWKRNYFFTDSGSHYHSIAMGPGKCTKVLFAKLVKLRNKIHQFLIFPFLISTIRIVMCYFVLILC